MDTQIVKIEKERISELDELIEQCKQAYWDEDLERELQEYYGPIYYPNTIMEGAIEEKKLCEKVLAKLLGETMVRKRISELDELIEQCKQAYWDEDFERETGGWCGGLDYYPNTTMEGAIEERELYKSMLSSLLGETIE